MINENLNQYHYSPIAIGVEYGGKDASLSVDKYVANLRKIAEEIATVHYGNKVGTLYYVFRVDGSVKQYDFEGPEDPEFNKKRKYAGIDLGILRNKWEGVSPAEIKKHIAQMYNQGFWELLKVAREKDKEFDHQRARKDTEQITSEFLI
jgi:hypothetical protein